MGENAKFNLHFSLEALEEDGSINSLIVFGFFIGQYPNRNQTLLGQQ